EDRAALGGFELAQPGPGLCLSRVAFAAALLAVPGVALLLHEVGDVAGDRGGDAEEQEPPHPCYHGQHHSDADGDEEGPPLRRTGRPGVVDRLRGDVDVLAPVRRWGSHRWGESWLWCDSWSRGDDSGSSGYGF